MIKNIHTLPPIKKQIIFIVDFKSLIFGIEFLKLNNYYFHLKL
ncbi:hypothetical protein EJK50_0925 [Moraxella catarrhalis]|nr:hypothetical protein EJK50_0925 [Moraxella catarrhalis]